MGHNCLKKILIILCLLILAIPFAYGSMPDTDNLDTVSWHITASSATYDHKRKRYIARGDVRITGGTTRIEADYVEYNDLTQDVFAQGNVILVSGEDSLTCTAMDLNLKTQKGRVHKGTLYIKKNNLYIHGENIRKTGEFTYNADKGFITSCSGDNPDWKISGNRILVTIDGYGSARDAVVWAGPIPALYMPYIAFPAKTTRQTGLLTPRFGSSDRKGYEVEQPLFMALSENTDATLYLDSMTKRGVKAALEFRYVLDNSSKGTMILDVLDDRKIDDGTDNTSDYRYAGTPLRTNTDRYWFRMKLDQELGNDVLARLDLDLVSDSDYLREFETGYTGFNETKAGFIQDFNRGIDTYDDTTRTNRLHIHRIWPQHSLNVDFQWFDNIAARQTGSADTTLQSLPAVTFNTVQQPLGKTGLYYQLESQATYFFRKDTTASDIRGIRADIYPRFYYPVTLSRHLSLTPSVGLRETLWRPDQSTDPLGEETSFHHRETYDISVLMSSRLHRVYQTGPSSGYRLKHDIIPEIEYQFSPETDQEEFPLFDALDRIGRTNQVTYAVTNRFISRTPAKTKDGTGTNAAHTYRELAWAKLYQHYYFNPEDHQDRDFSDIFLDSEFHLSPLLSLRSDLAWSVDESRFTLFNAGLRLRDTRGDSITLSYRYKKDISQSIAAKTRIHLTDPLHLYYIFEKDMETDKTIESQIGLELRQSCWSVDVSYSDSQDDKRIGVLITLHGLGGFGTR